jgi:2-hydroxychromene-2-carboxylate isomerase
MSKQLHWYFDFISPYAYFQFLRLDEFEAHADVVLHPLLFAGLLQAWEHKGPAEIPLKRRFTYRQVTWYARHHGIKFKIPPAHPFPPLPLLRLAHACQCSKQAVGEIFNYLWGEGNTPSNGAAFVALARSLGVDDPGVSLAHDAVKLAVRKTTDDAIAAGVFGVPTIFVNDELYWGVDSTEMALAHLSGNASFDDAEMRRVSDLPAEVARPQARI